jgi:hypothetical protein
MPYRYFKRDIRAVIYLSAYWLGSNGCSLFRLSNGLIPVDLLFQPGDLQGPRSGTTVQILKSVSGDESEEEALQTLLDQ